MLAQKELSVNYDKSKYLVMGSKKFTNSVEAETDSNPVKMGGVELEQSECEKYLGNLISDKGCVDSISRTIKNWIKLPQVQGNPDGLLAGMGNNKTDKLGLSCAKLRTSSVDLCLMRLANLVTLVRLIVLLSIKLKMGGGVDDP